MILYENILLNTLDYVIPLVLLFFLKSFMYPAFLEETSVFALDLYINHFYLYCYRI